MNLTVFRKLRDNQSCSIAGLKPPHCGMHNAPKSLKFADCNCFFTHRTCTKNVCAKCSCTERSPLSFVSSCLLTPQTTQQLGLQQSGRQRIVCRKKTAQHLRYSLFRLLRVLDFLHRMGASVCFCRCAAVFCFGCCQFE